LLNHLVRNHRPISVGGEKNGWTERIRFSDDSAWRGNQQQNAPICLAVEVLSGYCPLQRADTLAVKGYTDAHFL
jgi:Uma2 family endonuclease